MKNELDKLIFGFVIGGLLGGAVFYLLRANKKEKQLFFKRIGKAVARVGDFLKESQFDEKNGAFEEILKTLPLKKKTPELVALATVGISLWRQLSKEKL